MFTILIQEKGGELRRMVFNKPEVTIGRVQGNDIVLPKGNVSKRHARIVLKDGKFIIVDLKSTNGTYVNGRKITSPLVVKDSDKIYIGDFIVGVDEAASVDSEGASSETSATPAGERAPAAPRPPASPTEATSMPPSSGNLPSLPSLNEDRPPPSPTGPPPSARPMAPMAPRAAPLPAREAPPPARDLAPPRDLAPREMPPRDLAPPAREMPPLTAPRPPLARPGGTMPPPILAPIPPVSPLGGPASEATLPPPSMPSAMAPAMPRPDAAMAPLAAAPIQPPHVTRPEVNGPSSIPGMTAMGGTPAQVVPISGDKKRLTGAGAGGGAKLVVGRSVSVPSRRGVHLEPLDPKIVKLLDLQANLLERLRAKLDLDNIEMDRLHDEELWQRAERATVDLVETLDSSGELPKYIDQDTLIKETLNEALALGPLEDLLADEQVDEIIIDRRDRVVVGKAGVLRGSGKAFSSDDVFEKVVKRLVAEAGASIDEARPTVDLRMRDGTRLTAAVPPVAARGACLVLKKPAAQTPLLADLVVQHALSAAMADFLATCVTARRNILVCGAPAAGKTTLLGALAAAAPTGERVVSIEEVAELAIARDEWIQLETRAGTGRDSEIDLGHLLETALRMLPDRLVVGEVRGREALPLVQALCASVDGAAVAMTGEGANAALGRLAMLARLSAPHADSAVRELVAQAFEIVVHVARWADGTLRVVSVEEVISCTETTFDTHVLFQFSNGAFVATGTVPRFYGELAAHGIPADQAVFR